VIKSRASAETFDGIRRSTFAIRLYVATRHQRTPVSTRAPGRNRETRQEKAKRQTVVSGHLLEWRRTNNKLVHEHAECPIIDLLVVLATLDHLGWEVVERAAEGGPPIAGRVYAPTKIANLELAVDA